MTHFVFATRGIWASMQQMITDLNAQRFIWRRKDMNKNLANGQPNPNYSKVVDVAVQGILRPIQLWEYIYPKESPEQPGNLASPMIDNTDMIMRSFDLKGPDHYIPQSIGKYVKFLGKMIGLKPVPNVKPDGQIRYIHLVGTSVVPIGIKDDE